jgi:hypothetical protein
LEHTYLVKLYLGDNEVIGNAGDDLEQLYVWMLSQAGEILGDIHGEIIDNKTLEIVRQFRKCTVE